MNFDHILMRSILLDVEKHPSDDDAITGFTYEDKSQSDINRHVKILLDEKFIEGYDDGQERPEVFHITDLTFKGHQFLAHAKNDTTWKKAVEIIKEKGQELSMALLEAWLMKLTVGT